MGRYAELIKNLVKRDTGKSHKKGISDRMQTIEGVPGGM